MRSLPLIAVLALRCGCDHGPLISPEDVTTKALKGRGERPVAADVLFIDQGLTVGRAVAAALCHGSPYIVVYRSQIAIMPHHIQGSPVWNTTV